VSTTASGISPKIALDESIEPFRFPILSISGHLLHEERVESVENLIQRSVVIAVFPY
jgi:hypothetical protein